MIVLSNQGPHATLNFIREGNPLRMSAAKKSISTKKLGTGSKAGARDRAEWMFVFV